MIETTEVRTTHPDARRSRLRGIIARIDRSLPQEATLQVAWRELVDELALGPEPAMRNCPQCRAYLALEATRCGYCWATLPT